MPATRRPCASAYVPYLLRIRFIRILADEDFADKGLEIRSRGGQVDGAGRLLRAVGQRFGHAAVDDVDARLMDRAACWVAE